MNTLDIQIASQSKQLPSTQQFQQWVDTVLSDQSQHSEIVIRLIDEAEMISFNQQYRHKTGSTNILSFPFDAPEPIESDLLGDLLICPAVIEIEAQQQHKQLTHHWAHIVIHGLLHLLGYDHINDTDATEMESLEIKLLQKITINNPYKDTTS